MISLPSKGKRSCWVITLFFGVTNSPVMWLISIITECHLQHLTIIRRRRSDYRRIIVKCCKWHSVIIEIKANNCFSINTQVFISKKGKNNTFQREIIFTYSGKTTTGGHFIRLGDYRLIIRDSNESARFCIITCVFILTRFNYIRTEFYTPKRIEIKLIGQTIFFH